jgi:hypothetical protein
MYVTFHTLTITTAIISFHSPSCPLFQLIFTSPLSFKHLKGSERSVASMYTICCYVLSFAIVHRIWYHPVLGKRSKGSFRIFKIIHFGVSTVNVLGRSRWPRAFRCGCAAAHFLRLRVRIPPWTWMSVCCECSGVIR